MAQQPGSSPDDLPTVVDVLAARLVAVFAQAEQDLVAGLSAIARRGVFAPPGSAARLDMLRRMQDLARRIATALVLRSEPLAAQIATEAATKGEANATRTLLALVTAHPALATVLTRPQAEPVSALGEAAANRVAFDLAAGLRAAAYRITRFADDAYQAAVARTATGLLLGHIGTPAAAQRAAWDELMSQGVTGLVDTAGRRWNLASYVEMATRTAVQRAYNAAHQDRMTALGIDYFTVAPDGHPCRLCLPWEGRVLAATGAGVATEPAADTGRPVTFTVAATVDEARDAGLFHPNCKHTLIAYLPGVTRLTERTWTPADEDRYKATQRLRALERAVRAAKLRQQGALTPADRKKAAQLVRARQAAIRAHVDATGLVRRPRREQLHLGHH